jgi:BlaR1 peptidase M56
MENLITYLLKNLVLSALFTAYYILALRNKRIHRYNRFYLIAAMLISLMAPLLHLNLYDLPISFAGSLTAVEPVAVSGSWLTTGHLPATVLLVVAGLPAIALLVKFCAKIGWVITMKVKYKSILIDGINFIQTPLKEAPFTFLNNLFWKQQISLQDEDGARIYRHELTHIREKHSIDKLFFQFIVCIWWMNPFYRIMRDELNMIHEFLADASAVPEGDTDSFARMLLHAYSVGSYGAPYHSFFSSPVKRRLTMIANRGNASPHHTSRLLIVPVSLIAIALLSFSIIQAPVNGQQAVKPMRKSKMAAARLKVEYTKADGSHAIITKTIHYTPPAKATHQ